MERRLAVTELRLGMRVVRLDCPWLDSPFWRHQFEIRDHQQLQLLRQHCRYVYVESSSLVEPGELPRPRVSQPQTLVKASTGKAFTVPEKKLSQAFQQQLGRIDQLFNDIRLGRALDARRSREVVEALLVGVLRDPQGMYLWGQMQVDAPALAHKSLNVCVLALALARFIGLPNKRLLELGLGALLHDIGLLALPESLLAKRGRLLAGERQQMEQHCHLGEEMLRDQPGLSRCVRHIVAHHHERIDGQGYPARLQARQIPLTTRLVATVACYEAMTRERPYAKAVSPAQALRDLLLLRDTMLDGRLVMKLIRMLGIYPPGSVLRLKDDRVGMVLDRQETNIRLLLIGHYPNQPWATPQPLQLEELRVVQVLEPDDPFLEQAREGLSAWLRSLG